MRLIDADALKELFSEVIGHIAQKPEMNGNLEHMIRASAMVIQMIDDAPTVQPDTTTHDSIPAETGENDSDRTSGDCISRTQAIDALRGYLVEKRCPDDGTLTCRLIENEVINKLPSAQPERKIGHWVETGDEPYDEWECDACGFVIDGSGCIDPEEYRDVYRFCPNCGAKMDGGEEHETD